MKRLAPPALPAFTLIEVLVAATILIVMVGFMLAVADQSARIMRSTSGKIEQFRQARQGFERMTTRLSQATLNTYWDYNNATTPTRYERRSELRFLSGSASTLLGSSGTLQRPGHCVFFNAPLGIAETDTYRGLGNALNTWGYYLEFTDDSNSNTRKVRPDFVTSALVPPKWRWRLMEFAQPTEKFSVYPYTSGAANGIPNAATYNRTDWFKTAANAGTAPTRVVAENVVALIITPRLSKTEELSLQGSPPNPDLSPLAPDYKYDSTGANADARLNPKSQLPPIVQVTMVAIDEKSAESLQLDSSKWDLLGLSSKFTRTADFTKDMSLDSPQADSLEKKLVSLRAQYRIFTTNVHIRAAKWSREQKN